MYTIKRVTIIQKDIFPPADKSISHRAVIFSSIAKSPTVIENFLDSRDTQITLDCIRQLGIKADFDAGNKTVKVEGTGLYFPKTKKVELYAGESGTTMRILSGLLCAQKFETEFKAAPGLVKRPMGRIVYPLRKMGAKIDGSHRAPKEAGLRQKPEIYPPLSIVPSEKIMGKDHMLPVASAQVKSALMLAALYADRPVKVKEPYPSRDHTERMFSLFKVPFKKEKNTVICGPYPDLRSPGRIFVPADFSSAAFFIVLGLILKKSLLIIKNVNVNPTRCRLLEVLKTMGADIETRNFQQDYEPYADILVKSSNLKGVNITADLIPSIIDEVPILCVAAAFAKGPTIIEGLDELRVKETDRIDSISSNLEKVGVKVLVDNSSGSWRAVIKGTKKFNSQPVIFSSFGDHRTAMSAVILGAALGTGCAIDDIQCIDKSFPQFIPMVEALNTNCHE